MLLPPEVIYFINLIMCYGARSGSSGTNHEGVLTTTQLKNSFAYPFYREICTVITVALTAYTGAIGFDESTGRALVQTETAIGYEIQDNELQQSLLIRRAGEPYDGLKDTYFRRHGNVDGFLEMETRVFTEINRRRTDWSMASETEIVIRNYYLIMNRVTELTKLKGESKGKYGKFKYLYYRGEVNIIRRYPHQIL
jgi:hypothetical protein